MIIGEALNRRSDLQKRIAQLQDRVSACVLAQEGEEPPESPDELLAELAGLCDQPGPLHAFYECQRTGLMSLHKAAESRMIGT